MTASGLAVQAPPAHAEQVTPEQPVQSTVPLEAADEAAAMALAYKTRRQVLVTGLTTESTLTWAMPDGTFKAEVQSGPVRTQDENGNWVDVDLTLVSNADGRVAPRAHPRGLTLSGARTAGSTDFASLGSGDE
ncbi:MAG TPA: hypothetical protein VGD43_21745, partial [Micromonospora sp.]